MFKEAQFDSTLKYAGSKKEEILASFSIEEQDIIESKRKTLSGLAFFIGKDFNIPVELNEPGAGWHWDFKENVIRIDPKDLLEKDMEYLKFVISHEGGHRRISRTDFIPLEVWQQPGFSFMMNSIEDPRDNNFVAEAYPKFREQLPSGYEWLDQMEKEVSGKAKEKLGYQPRFKQAGFEYIRRWFREIGKQDEEKSIDLAADVQEIVDKTMGNVRRSYLTYPTREEADKGGVLPSGKNVDGEEMITAFAQASYKINFNKVWPEYKKLVEKDLEDQKMQEFMKDMEKEKAEGEKQNGGGQDLPQELKDKLTKEEQKELEEALDKAIKENQDPSASSEQEKDDKKDGEKEGESSKGESVDTQTGESGEQGEKDAESSAGKPIDLGSLSDGLKQKIKDYMDSLPDDKKKELVEKAEKAIKEFEKEMNEEIEGKLTQNPEKINSEKSDNKSVEKDEQDKKDAQNKQQTDAEKREKIARQFREQAERSLIGDKNEYEKHRREILPIINKLEDELRDIFVARRSQNWQTGYKSGKRIDIEKRIQEKAKGISVMESKAWQKREIPLEKDYAITILVDLSGSMNNRKIIEAFKSSIVIAEVLNRLSVRTEILGFNDRIYEYKKFSDPMSNELRENMSGMLKEVSSGRARYNDDGWAIRQASLRLEEEQGQEKFLIVLSDGEPVPSRAHSGQEYDLKNIIESISKNTKQKVIGLGILTNSVKSFYKQYLPNISAEDLSKKLAQLIKDCIENYDKN